MKNKIIFTSLIGLASFFVFNFAHADTTIHLDIEGPSGSLYNSNITVSPCDSDNHGTLAITAYCAVLQSGVSSNWSWYSFGAFLNSINSIVGYTTKDENNQDIYHYWSWSLNSNVGMTGMNTYVLQQNDSILVNFYPDSTYTKSSITGGLPIITAPIFSIDKANSFLATKQKSDGSFGDMLYTDWVAISSSASMGNVSFFSSLKNFLQNNTLDSSVVTDNERHAMALMSLGINPYSGTNINYIKKITDSFDGTQFGDSSLVNDDIFALIVLPKAGLTSSDDMIKKDVTYIISKQSSNGSWGSVDMTSAAIQALHNFTDITGVTDAIAKGYNYLINSQNPDGGFGNYFSTSWAIQALYLDTSASTQITKADRYIAQAQADDGGLGLGNNTESRIWATAYAIPSVLHMSWNNILQSFSKPAVINTPTTIITSQEITQTQIIKIKHKKVNTDVVITKKDSTNTLSNPPSANSNNFGNFVKNMFIRLFSWF